MPSDHTLISTVAVSLGYAFVGGLAVSRVGLPPLVGYLLAGVAVGPFTPGFVADPALAPQLAEVGVMLLMFGVGLHFSLDDLVAVRRVAVPGAVVQMLAATALGYGLARWLGFPPAGGLVFGLCLSVASTVVLLRALEATGRLHTPDGRTAVGWLVVEDLVMVVALVLLPALGGDRPAGGHPLLAAGLAVVEAVVCVGLLLGVGGRVFPWLLARVDRTGSRELFTLAVTALALGVTYGAARLFGVSLALGAFFAGMVVNRSDLSHRAAADVQPLQDVFAALFFVSVGMLFDPAVVVRQPLALVATVLVVVVGKSVAAFALVLALGRPLRTALTVSAALAQVGEFSFILAALGVGYGVLPPAGQELVVAAALVSITLNSFVLRLAARLGRPDGAGGIGVATAAPGGPQSPALGDQDGRP